MADEDDRREIALNDEIVMAERMVRQTWVALAAAVSRRNDPELDTILQEFNVALVKSLELKLESAILNHARQDCLRLDLAEALATDELE